MWELFTSPTPKLEVNLQDVEKCLKKLQRKQKKVQQKQMTFLEQKQYLMETDIIL
ncbi:hypothetical protein TTHERM_000701240 (macronuclear) [Tetrahymena thermophila SB210]|uniref:Uncharacterized protein n=1 Tax=Tetrahymena thermophila (strain SB210) TaxID=312017 RepID=W7XFQ3_TETTS|nr:hypothetical protein TTHERM_000701240 [Tetrahymena thermophila SB210]EWS76702.1 hypothetical protein TTHERM_000701240 [Tetrahymena thermophila SB210]|eukprot:XP_012650772.1 hypothetical protein TTHERM_000701240 [Tetrahymena thermophila SB210]